MNENTTTATSNQVSTEQPTEINGEISTKNNRKIVQIKDEKTNELKRVEITDENSNTKVFYRVNKKIKNKKRPNKDPEHPKQPAPNQCHYFVKRKNRYCHLTTKKGKNYCGEHALFDPENNERIPCPYDNAHSVIKKDLEKHLERCNSKPKPKDESYVENINIVNMDALQVVKEKLPREEMMAMEKDEFKKFTQKIMNAFDDAIKGHEIVTEILDHEALHERKIATHEGKHATQQASIIGHLEKIHSLDKKNAYVEFGAGKGELTYYVRKAVGDPSTYVLVDRRNFRMKFDRENSENNTNSESKDTVQKRLYMDIKDLCLEKLECIKDKPVVGISKHLCGCATDLTLKCLVNYSDKNPEAVKAIFIALCCHQICKYGMYCNPEYIKKYGFTQDDFEKICTLSTWAICGKRENKDKEKDNGSEENEKKSDSQKDEVNKESDEDDEEENETKKESEKDKKYRLEDELDDPEIPHWSGMSFEERTTFGRKCKRFLDLGRLNYLLDHGYKNVRLVHYVDTKYSLENCALIVDNN